VHAEQVRTLYVQSAPVLLANVLNAVIVSCVLWSDVSRVLLVGWTSAMTAMALTRIELRKRYWSATRSHEEHAAWGTRFTLGSLSAGVLWGFAGGVLMPGTLLHQLVIVFVLAGMAAGAAASISCYLRAYYAYLIPSLLPTLLRLVLGGDEQRAMGGMLLLFIVALSLIARNVQRALTHAFRLSFENSALNARLVRANELLETRVQERTEELRLSQRALWEIVSESPDAIVVFDESGGIISANPATERITGRPLGALTGKHFAETETLGPDDARRAMDVFGDLLAGKELHSEEYRILRPSGEPVMIEAKSRVVVGADGQRRVHAVLRDVSERHRLQRLKEAYETRLREAERLESVGMLAGGVAHDFNNALTMILGNLDLLEAMASDAKGRALLNEIRHGSLQAASLTKQLLAFSRQQLLDVKPTDLTRVASTARPLFERALGEQNELVLALPREPMVALVDATQIEQAILNLLVNARHAMPNGGTVALELDRIQIGDESEWPDAAPGPYVRLTITDTGTGMDEATRSRVFEPFFTTKGLGHGTGLGLSSVHGVIKQAGGHICVTSEPGLGTSFEIILPCHAAPAPELATNDAPVWTPGTGTVLVVEDQARVRHSLQRILEDAGYQVLAAEDGEQALELARKREGRIDLVISDVIMPGLSGVELGRRLLALYPQVALLLVSGYAGSEITRLGELGENVHFLQKPFDAVSLTSAAHNALQRARAQARSGRPVNLVN
jgi:two-component system cell cycle sensor histidine kinase/response regulator CckA